MDVEGEVGTAAVTFWRKPLYNDLSEERGPFDIIGDVHGCYEELRDLLELLGYEIGQNGLYASCSSNRRAIFLGDLVNRGPMTPAVLRLVMSMVSADRALCVLGNHEVKLLAALKSNKTTTDQGLAESLEQLRGEPEEFVYQVIGFLDSLLSHYVLDNGNLVVSHAGLPESMHGQTSDAAKMFALYGDTAEKVDEFGLPLSSFWAQNYRGLARVVYGHTPVSEPTWLNGTICLDTGCVYGGRLTALRYPELELTAVAARRLYYKRSRSFG